MSTTQPRLATTAHDQHRSPAAEPTAPAFPAAGPHVDLVALPCPGHVDLTVPEIADAHLAQLEIARQRQLDIVPSSPPGTVTAAYRATVEQLLTQVRAARERVAAGLYGICTRCGGEIAPPRLAQRPWVVMCAACASE